MRQPTVTEAIIHSKTKYGSCSDHAWSAYAVPAGTPITCTALAGQKRNTRTKFGPAYDIPSNSMSGADPFVVIISPPYKLLHFT
jgi:hypothetical protein